AWNLYRAHLGTPSMSKNGSFDIAWGRKTNELLADLLYEMSTSLGYHFDKAFIERGIYSPAAHGNLERDQKIYRDFVVGLAKGNTAIPVTVISVSDQTISSDPSSADATELKPIIKSPGGNGEKEFAV